MEGGAIHPLFYTGMVMKSFNSYIKEDMQLTLQYHDELNPLVWENEKMKESVRNRLLQIGKMWGEFSHIPETAIRDIVLTGGNANYNYTPFSDLDVHLMVDLDKIPVDREFLDDYLYDKKILWAYKHASLTVMGYPVELYAQNYREPIATQQGVYSLKKGKWLYKPKHENHPDFMNDKALVSKIEEYTKMLDKILSEPGDHVAEITKIKEKLHAMRGAAIHQAGEFSNENLLYKELRNRGYLDKLGQYLQKQADAKLSLY
jgi:hypothetical protein